MNWKTESFDWNQAKSFLAAVETGSLSAAARELGLTQPTLSRQISALEESLGVILLERGHRALSLTQSGMELLEHVRSMNDAADRIALAASGQSQDIGGDVCITASDTMSAYHLPPLLNKLRSIAPGINIEVHSSNEARDLLRREADIAIRNFRPEQLDLITKLIREPQAGLYASKAYLDETGGLDDPTRVSHASFIGYENADRSVSIYENFGLNILKDQVRYISNAGVVVHEMIKQGLGIGILDDQTGYMSNDIERIFPNIQPVTFPIWLTTHRELHTNRRIRIVYDFLAEELRKAPFKIS